jgi:hypothetical protein
MEYGLWRLLGILLGLQIIIKGICIKMVSIIRTFEVADDRLTDGKEKDSSI